MAAAREAATAVGNQDSGSTPAPAKGSGPAIDQVRNLWPYAVCYWSTGNAAAVSHACAWLLKSRKPHCEFVYVVPLLEVSMAQTTCEERRT